MNRRTTTASKIGKGNFRPSTARPDAQLAPGVPRAPKWLGVEAKAEWRRIVRALSEAGALAEAHRSTLVTYCSLWGEFEQAQGAMPTARLGELRRLTAELGISPRSGSVGPEPDEPQAPGGHKLTRLDEARAATRKAIGSRITAILSNAKPIEAEARDATRCALTRTCPADAETPSAQATIYGTSGEPS